MAKTSERVKPVVEKASQKPKAVALDFGNFLREQGIIGLAIAVVLGGAVTKVVQALVADLINPLIGVMTGSNGDLAEMKLTIGSVEFMWGHFLATIIDFLIIALVVYIFLRVLRLDKIDKKKETVK